jgi:hypothetical protein
LQEAIRQSLKDGVKPKPAAPASGDLLDFDGPPAAAVAALPPSTSDIFGAPLPAISGPTPAAGTSNGYASDFAAAGALVVAAPSAGYSGYGAPAENPYGAPATNPYGVPASNPYGGNPYASSAPAVANSAPYQYTAATQTSNPYGAPAPTANPYAAPAPAANPYTVPAPGAAANPYGAPVSAAANPYAAPAPVAVNPYAAPAPAVANPYAASAPAANPYGAPAPDAKSSWTPPAPISTQPNPYDSTQPNPYDTFNGAVPPDVTPHAQQTPSSLGFGSPAADFSGFSPVPNNPYADEKPAAAPSEQVLTMNSLNGHEPANDGLGDSAPARSIVDQAYAKLANLDTFSIVSNKETNRANPFEYSGSSTVGGNKSLADMQKTKVSGGWLLSI